MQIKGFFLLLGLQRMLQCRKAARPDDPRFSAVHTRLISPLDWYMRLTEKGHARSLLKTD